MATDGYGTMLPVALDFDSLKIKNADRDLDGVEVSFMLRGEDVYIHSVEGLRLTNNSSLSVSGIRGKLDGKICFH